MSELVIERASSHKTLRCLLLIVTVCYISFLLSFIVTVVSAEDLQCLFARYTFVAPVTAVLGRLGLQKFVFRCLLLIVTVR